MLLLDNASSHRKQEDFNFSNVEIKFLPTNTTSHLQALDQGIIRTFMTYYRRSILRSLLTKMESAVPVTELCKKVTLLDAIGWVVKAWDIVKTQTIVKCFKSVGSSSSFREFEISSDLGDDDDYDDNDVPRAVLVQQFRYTRDEFEQLDENVPREDDSDEWECNLMQSFKETLDISPGYESDSDSEDVPEQFPGCDLTHNEVLEMLITIKNFAMEK